MHSPMTGFPLPIPEIDRKTCLLVAVLTSILNRSEISQELFFSVGGFIIGFGNNAQGRMAVRLASRIVQKAVMAMASARRTFVVSKLS